MQTYLGHLPRNLCRPAQLAKRGKYRNPWVDSSALENLMMNSHVNAQHHRILTPRPADACFGNQNKQLTETTSRQSAGSPKIKPPTKKNGNVGTVETVARGFVRRTSYRDQPRGI